MGGQGEHDGSMTFAAPGYGTSMSVAGSLDGSTIPGEHAARDGTAAPDGHATRIAVGAQQALEAAQAVQAAITKSMDLASLDRPLLAAVLRCLPTGIVVAEASSGCLIAVNERAAELLCRPLLPSHTINDQSVWQGFSANGTPLQPDEWPLARAAHRGETVQDEDLTVVRGDGSLAVLRTSAAPVVGANGAVVAAVATFADVTEQRRVAERMNRLHFVTAALSEALTPEDVAQVVVGTGRASLSASGGCVAVVEIDEEAQSAGRAEARVLRIVRAIGYPDEAVKRWQRLSLDTELPLSQVARSGMPLWLSGRETIAASYPEVGSVQEQTGNHALCVVPLRVDGRVLGVLGLSFDRPMTLSDADREYVLALAHQCAQALERARLFEAQRGARERAEIALESRNAFLSAAAHELKTPLTSLRLTAQLHQARLGRGAAAPEATQRALDEVVQHSKRLSRLVDQLLDLTRIERGTLTIRRELVDVVALVRGAVDVVRVLGPRHTIDVRTPVASLDAELDPVRVEQLVINLVDNAVKYTPAGTCIEIALAVEQPAGGNRSSEDAPEAERDEVERLVLSVRDSGPGISVEHRQHIFDPFYRGDPNTSLSGMGLGLYLCTQIVAAHDGSIEATFPEGGGTIITARLPRFAHGA